jgi:hypothetical protein
MPRTAAAPAVKATTSVADGPQRARLGLSGRGSAGAGRALRLGPFQKDRFSFFSNLFFQCENNSSKHQKMFLEHEKYSKNHKNSRKIPRDRLRHEQSK